MEHRSGIKDLVSWVETQEYAAQKVLISDVPTTVCLSTISGIQCPVCELLQGSQHLIMPFV